MDLVNNPLTRWLGRRLRTAADVLDYAHAPKFTQRTFTFEPGEGLRFRTDGRGCRLWYLGEDEYQKAFTEADSNQPAARAAADPDRACPHRRFHVQGDIDRVVETTGDTVPVGFYASVAVTCDECGEPFRWTGLPAGLSPGHPTCSVDERILVAPLRPASADPDFGLGLPGFAVRYHDGDGVGG